MQSVVRDADTDKITAYVGFHEGRWNHPDNKTSLEFRFKLSVGMRPHDMFVVKETSSYFDFSEVTNCRSVLLPAEYVDKWDGVDDWTENRVQGDQPMINTDKEYQQYPIRTKITDRTIIFYGFYNLMDAESDNVNHTLAVFRCDNFKNPSTIVDDKDYFAFSFTTKRYHYTLPCGRAGPIYTLETKSDIHLDDSMQCISSNACDPPDEPDPPKLKKMQCEITNEYSEFQVVNKKWQMPAGLVMFWTLTLTARD